MEIDFEVRIGTGILYDYLLHHTYSSLSGLAGTVVGALMVVAFFSRFNYLLLIAGVVILLYLPVTLFVQAGRQALMPAFKKPLHYHLSEEGIEVSQEGQSQLIPWDQCLKAHSTLSSILVYTGRNSAFIFPRKDLGEKLSATIECISIHMPPNKVKIRM